MTLSRIVKTNTVYDSYFWVKWELSDQNIAGNKSTISWSCGVTPGHKFYSNAVKMSAVTINGSQVYAGGTYSNITDYKERALASGTLDISHSSDGSKTFTVSAFSGKVWKEDSGGYLTATAAAQSFALPTIPRSTVPVIGSVVLGQTTIISLPRAVPSFTHTLTYSFGSYSGIIAEGAATDAEWRDVPYDFATQIPSSPTGTGTLTCKTYNGSTLIGTQSVNFTVVVPNNSATQPSDTISISPVSSLAKPFNSLYIQGRTKAKITHTAVGKYGTTIKSYTATVDDQTYTGQDVTTEILSIPGSRPITGTVTDNRNIPGTTESSIMVLAYTPPSVERNTSANALVCARALADGTLDDDGTALYVACSRKYSRLDGNNAASVQARYKAESGEWSAWVTFFAESASGDNYAGIIAGITLAVELPYTIELRAVDKLGESGGTLSFAVSTSEATVDLGEGGNSVGVGRLAHVGTEKRLDVAWNAYFEKGLQVGGNLTAAGELRCTWVKATDITDLGNTADKVAVINQENWIYYRTMSELLKDMGINDYIVEQGTSGIWTYRKWNSGLGEYWGKEQGFPLDDGWHRSPAAPFTLVNTDKAVATVTNWYGTDDNRAARSNIITCGGIYADGSISIYDRNYDGTLGTGYRAYNYDVKARWK